LVLLVSRPLADLTVTPPPDNLICPAAELFDEEAIKSAVAEITLGPADACRGAFVELLKTTQKSARDRIAQRFTDRPFDARPATRSYAFLTDALVTTAFAFARDVLHTASAAEAERLTLVGVGGYGRGEMAPYSDVDLLFLTPTRITPQDEQVIEATLYILWDLKMKVGHASRTVKECLKLGKEDYTIRTSLLEQRYLAGDEALAQELRDRLVADLFRSTGPEFVEAKLDERATRHSNQGGQRYVLEPNVKEGKGGLRDLQSLFWIAKYIHNVEDAADLMKIGVFTEPEYRSFQQAEDFLWGVRCHMHLVAGRATEQLTFDMQVDVARRLGFEDQGGRRDVEHFMQAYFRHATRVGELTRIFLTALEAAHVKKVPSLTEMFRPKRRKKLKDGYVERQGRLDIAEPDTFFDDPVNLMRLFEEGLRSGLLLHPNVMRAVTANLDLINADLRASKEANRIFLDLLLKHGNPERGLRRMNELGVLGAFIPEFQNIVAMMQFNVYHHYTVDEHTIQVISTLAQIERNELTEELPIASGILKRGINRKVLYVALLLHDIGKGRPEDHSVLGAHIARRVVPQLGLNAREEETVVWLIRYHLLMSDMAQKRDLSDPRTVRDFAKLVKTRERLDLLCVLTVCDIRGVGPRTWNNWKAQLLRSLFRQTAEALETGMEDLNREHRGAEAKRALREALAGWPTKDLRRETARHYEPYWQGMPPEVHVRSAELLRDIEDDDMQLDLTLDADRDVTRVLFVLQDHPGIFSRLAGALAIAAANTVDARTYTTKDGFVISVFWVQDPDGAPYAQERLPRLKRVIGKAMRGEVVPTSALQSKDKMRKRDSQFRFPTSISFDNDGSEIFTIIEVDTRDRPGLLYDITRTLANANIYVSSAQIATYGAQAVDSFYVKDLFGLKITTKSKQEALSRKLLAAIKLATERAQA
jgi:[protein-PII] uridylyltransferase